MASEQTATGLAEALESINQLITGDRNLSIKALGLLLLQRNIEEEEAERYKHKDPTELILRDPGIKIPEL